MPLPPLLLLPGWAASVTFNPKAKAEFERFRQRSDTLSLGVCNGCQLLALLGWVGEAEEDGSGALVSFNCHVHTAEASNLFFKKIITIITSPSPRLLTPSLGS